MNVIRRSVGLGLLLVACAPPVVVEDKGPPPSAGHFTLECATNGVRAFDAARSLIPGVPIQCAAHVGDQTGAPTKPVVVSFLAEAGRLPAEATTSVIGAAEVTFETGLPLPLDVSPGVFSYQPADDALHTGTLLAPMWMLPTEWIEEGVNVFSGTFLATLREPRRPDPLRLAPDGGRVENNPRDNLVTLVAIADGEEAFEDVNANGTWDPGETFVDLTEPFVDADDDGTRSGEEPFLDTNGNGRWDGKNGRWDGATKIWTATRVLWTGVPAREDSAPVVVGVTGNRPTASSNATSARLSCPGGPLCSQAGPPVNVIVFLADPWFNRLAHERDSDGCEVVGSPTVRTTLSYLDLGPSPVWPGALVSQFVLADARSPTGPQVDRRVPPLPFTVSLVCHLTGVAGANPEEFVFEVISGTIE